jgi:hypothetical protein
MKVIPLMSTQICKSILMLRLELEDFGGDRWTSMWIYYGSPYYSNDRYLGLAARGFDEDLKYSDNTNWAKGSIWLHAFH